MEFVVPVSIFFTDRALEHLTNFKDKTLKLELKPTGCAGYKINPVFISNQVRPEGCRVIRGQYRYYDRNHLGSTYPLIWCSKDLISKLLNGLVVNIDYLDTGLFQGLHVSVSNAAKCGCGESFQ
jgi:Fe-S cluster assembly iron-binding protein IscA